ncbi:MAG: hypothetical protein PHZ19_10840, partial [Candidatus Thermoplasmatota archaeon]|nr:hypothetical protein [Candidatus Thermoplasmatota archaeon]
MPDNSRCKDAYSYRYACKLRPYHGGDVARLTRMGIDARPVPADATPEGYQYAIETTLPVPREVREHFGLRAA